MKKLFRDCFSGIDGTTYDVGRILWAAGVGVLVLIGLVQVGAGALALFGHTITLAVWTPSDWALWATGAFCTTLGAGAGALLLKKSTEPSVKVTQTTNDGDGNTATVEAKS